MPHDVDLLPCPERVRSAQNTEESTSCTLSTKIQPDSSGSSPAMTSPCFPGAMQREALAQRCFAEPGSPKTRRFVRPRLCSAPLREELRAVLRPGNQRNLLILFTLEAMAKHPARKSATANSPIVDVAAEDGEHVEPPPAEIVEAD